MSNKARTFRLVGVAYGAGFARYVLNFTFTTNQIEQELIWAQARREAKKHIGSDASISITSLKEVL